MKTKINSSANFVFDPSIHCEHPKGESQTVPNMTLTIQEVIEKSHSGLPVIGKNRQFGGDGVIVNNPIDITELEQTFRNHKQNEADKKQQKADALALKIQNEAENTPKPDPVEPPAS